MIRAAAARRRGLAVFAALLLAGVLAAAAPGGRSATDGTSGSLAPVGSATTAAGPANGCASNGSGCARAGTYPNLNAPISSDFGGFRVTWASSSVYPTPGKAPALWYAFVTFKNVTSSREAFTCSADWPSSASDVVEVISGGGGNDRTVAAAGTPCIDGASLTRTVPPGGVFTAYLAFETVPWPGNKVALRLGGIGRSAPQSPFAASSLVTTCLFLSEAPCQSLRPTVTVDLYDAGDESACDFSWDVAWGDGAHTDDISQDGPPEGYLALASHSYRKAGTFTMTFTGTVTSGDCTVRDGSEQFTLLGYAALGDSYSSGVGAGNYLPGNNPGLGGGCIRSYSSYEGDVDSRLGDDPKSAGLSRSPFTFVACSGATVGDLELKQLGVLQQSTGNVGLVTFTIGGDDLNFAGVMTDCVMHVLPFHKSCQATDGKAVAEALRALKAKLIILFHFIATSRGLTASGRVVVAGYPEFFDPKWFRPKVKTPTCGTGVAGVDFLASDMKWLNDVAQQLDAELQQEATLFDFEYAADLTAYSGHYLCEKTSDVHAVSVPLVISFHPTGAGQQAIAGDVEKALRLG